MNGDFDKAKEYRQRAEAVRLMARQTADGETRKVLLLVAENYEHLALTRENIARSDMTRISKSAT